MLRSARTAGSVKPRRRTETKLKDRKGPNTSIILTLWRSHCDWRIRGLGPSGDALSTVRCAKASRVARASAALRQEARLRLRVHVL